MERKDGGIDTVTTTIPIASTRCTRPFKPTSLRSAPLTILLLVTLALLGLVEYASRTLPTVNNDGSFIDTLDTITAPIDSNIVPDILTDISLDLITQDDSAYTSPNSALRARHIRKTIIITTSCVIASKLRIKVRQTSAPNPNAFLVTNPTLETTIITTTLQDTVSELLSSEDSTGFFATSVRVSAPNPFAYLNTDATTIAESATAPLSDSSVYLNTATITTSVSLAPAPPNYLQTASTTYPTNPGPDYFLHKSGHISNGGAYFVGAYLPTLLAVLFSLPWIFINHNARSIEPFWQLSKSRGASAESTLTANFQAPLAPLHILLHGQWTLVITTTLMGLGILIAPLAPEAIAIHTEGQCSATTRGCSGNLGISMPVARTIQSILASMAFLTIILIVNLSKKNLSAPSDPRSITGLCLLFLNPDVRRDFSQLQTLPTESELKTALRGNTYKIDTITFQDGFTSTGFVKFNSIHASPEFFSSEKHVYSTLNWDQKLAPSHRVSAICLFIFLLALAALVLAYRYTSGDNGFEQFMDSQGFGVRFLFTLVGVITSLYWRSIFEGTTPVFRVLPQPSSGDVTHFYTPDIALLAPYRALVLGNATARSSILFTAPSHPLSAIHVSLSAGHYVLAVVAIAAILSEILTITLSTIPFSSANLYSAYRASTWITIAIIIIMLGILLLLFFYKEPQLPVKPKTVAAHLVYLCDSALPGVFKDMGDLDTKGVKKRIEEYGYRYRLDVIQSYTGASKLNVDFER